MRQFNLVAMHRFHRDKMEPDGAHGLMTFSQFQVFSFAENRFRGNEKWTGGRLRKIFSAAK